MSNKLTARDFFSIWKTVCSEPVTEDELKRLWYDGTASEYSRAVLGRSNSNSVVQKIKAEINRRCKSPEGIYDLHQEYYGCDAVYYDKSEDRLHEDPLRKIWAKDAGRKSPSELNAVWLRKVRIHLEHENDIKASWQEIAQFCVVPGRDLNVLVTYPDSEENTGLITAGYLDILRQSGIALSLLVVFGFLKDRNSDIAWKGFELKGQDFKEIL